MKPEEKEAKVKTSKSTLKWLLMLLTISFTIVLAITSFAKLGSLVPLKPNRQRKGNHHEDQD